MSKNSSNNSQIKPKLERLHLSNKPKILLTEDIIHKIKYLCRAINKEEWSGVLFYIVNGSIKDADNMEIIIKDILPMHRGDGTTTGFDWNEEVVAYQMDNPEVIDWIKGHIHSHHSMGVFFSSTDWDELNDNCTAHNFYLSVIVNNYMDIIAKIAFTAQAPTNQFICKDEDGKDYTLTFSNDSSLIKPYMFTYDCTTNIPEMGLSVPDNFSSRVEVINKRYAKASIAYTGYSKSGYQSPSFDKYNDWGDKHREAPTKSPAPAKSPFPDYNPKNKRNSKEWDDAEDWHGFIDSYNPSNANITDDTTNDEVDYTQSTIEQDFSVYILRLGNIVKEDDELIDALEEAEAAQIDAVTFAESIRDQYGPLYETFFDKYTKYLDDDDVFLDVLSEVIGIYEEHEGDYPLLTPIINALKEVGAKLENYIETKKQHAKQT